jgi:hypothetical protein
LLLVAMMLGSAGARADSVKVTPKKPVALFVDVSEEQVPQAGAFKGKQFDLNGLPVVVGSGSNNDVGLQAGHRLDLGGGFSVDGDAAAAHRLDPAAILSRHHGMSEMTTGATGRFQQRGWDIALFPEVSTARLVADRLPSYVLGGSVAREGSGGWSVETMSRYERRRTDTLTGEAGANALGQLEITHLPVLGAALDLGYVYDWAQPKSGSATLSHGPSVALDLGLSDTVQCRVAYRYAFVGDVSDAGPAIGWLGDGKQDLTVGWDWELAEAGIPGTTFGAAFAYHQDFFAAPAPAQGSAGLNLAMAF